MDIQIVLAVAVPCMIFGFIYSIVDKIAEYKRNNLL